MQGDTNEAPHALTIPRWTCHKEVNASKILAIEQAPADQEKRHVSGDWCLTLECGLVACVGHDDYIVRHNPQVGGYYVRYEDGYLSYSPAKAFEEGYSVKVDAKHVDDASIAAVSSAPRVTRAELEANIAAEYSFTADKAMGQGVPLMPSLSLLTLCVLVLRNGFTVVGQSACASPENFNADIGCCIAREDAIRQVWPLMGYELRSKLHARAQYGTSQA